MEWELTEDEILNATQVEMFLPNGDLDPDCGFLKGRQQVAHKAQKKLVEWINEQGLAPLDKHGYADEQWDELEKALGIEE